jgi:hypothetical protein
MYVNTNQQAAGDPGKHLDLGERLYKLENMVQMIQQNNSVTNTIQQQIGNHQSSTPMHMVGSDHAQLAHFNDIRDTNITIGMAHISCINYPPLPFPWL